MMGGTSKGSKCSISSCNNRSSQKNIKFFRFPNINDHERLQKWKLACNNKQIMAKASLSLYSNYRICSVHFEEKFMQGHYLRHDAIPTLHLLQVPVAGTVKKSMPLYIDVATQTDDAYFKVNCETQTDTPQLWNVTVQTPKKLLPKLEKEKMQKKKQEKQSQVKK